VIGIGSPDKGLGFAVVLTEIAVDRGLQIDERMEDAALQPSPGERGKEALDRICPGTGGGREMKRPPRMAGQPGAHLGMLVGGVVVEDRVHQLSGRHGGLDAVQKADELLVAMSRSVPPDCCGPKNSAFRRTSRLDCQHTAPGGGDEIGRPGAAKIPHRAVQKRRRGRAGQRT